MGQRHAVRSASSTPGTLRTRRNLVERRRAARFRTRDVAIPVWITTAALSAWSLTPTFTTTALGQLLDDGVTSDPDTSVFPPGLFLMIAILIIGLAAGWDLRHKDVPRRALTRRQDGTPLPAWQYSADEGRMFPHRFTTFPLGAQHTTRFSNVAWGPRGDRVVSAYTAWPTKRHRYSIEQVELLSTLPALMLIPMRFYDSFATALGGSDYRVASHEFNSRWRVMTDDARFASDFLHPRMVSCLLDNDVQDTVFVCDGGALLSWMPGRRPVEDVSPRFTMLDDLASLIPGHVYADHGAPRDPAWISPHVTDLVVPEPTAPTTRRERRLAAQED